MPSLSAEPAPTVAPAARPSSSAPEALSVAAAVALVLSTTTVVLAAVGSGTGDYQLQTLVLGSDLALLALVVVASRSLPGAVRSWRRHGCTLAAATVGLMLVPAFLAHPSDRGVAAMLRWAGLVAVALAVATARREGRRLVVGALTAVTLVHVAVAVAQRLAGGPVGLGALGEPSAYEIGGHFASAGLTVHPYVLAAWCAVTGPFLLVAAHRRSSRSGAVAVAGIVAFGAIGLTLSRAGVLAGALGLGALAASALRSRDRRLGTAVVAAGAALAAGVLANLPGWVVRAGQPTGSVDAISSGRGALLGQAWRLLQDNLLTGVGPGRYVLALVERPELVSLSEQSPRPVHLTPLLVVVEGGLIVVPALVLLAFAIGRACWRGGAPAVAVTLGMLPFLALDHLAWSYPQGIVLTGVWLGALDLLARRRHEGPEPRPAAGARHDAA